MSCWRGQEGAGAIRALLTLVLVVGLVYGALKFIPVRAAAFQLDDSVREQVVLAGARRRRVSDDQIRAALLDRAKDLGLPLDRRNIKIRRGKEWVRVEVDYAVPIHLPLGYTYEWKFATHYEGPAF